MLGLTYIELANIDQEHTLYDRIRYRMERPCEYNVKITWVLGRHSFI